MLQSLRSFFLHPQSIIVGSGFTSLSLLMATWATRLPELKVQLDIDDGQVGIGLLVLSIGGLIMTIISNFILDRFPTGQTTYISVLLQSVFYLLPFIVQSYALFLVAMFFVGLASGFLTITANSAATNIEKKYGMSIMSSVHGMFSVGIILGSISAGFIAGMGISPAAHMAGLVLLICLLNILFRKTWFSIPDSDLKAPVFAIPTLPILGFAAITFCIVFSEMTILDWSGVYLKDTLKSKTVLTGLGLAGFSLTMAIGRLLGDSIVPIIGKRRIIVLGCILAAFGLSIAAYTLNPIVAIFGFTISGAGMATIVPLLYSLSANMKNVSPGIGIASIASACILAGLIGRPLVGWVSDYAGMAVSMWIAAGFSIIAGMIAFSKRK